jgi:hypothetical protein
MQVIDINGNICAKTTGGSVAWGTITGTLSSQTDLQTALNAKQDTLVSGTNIKTINSTSILGSGNIVISTGLTVGTTAIASGTIGRILFEGTGNVLQEDSALFWDNTNKRLGVGATPSTAVRLDVRAQGALVTDIALRVRNSADTADLFQVNGLGNSTLNSFNLGGGVPAINIQGVGVKVNPYLQVSSDGNTSYARLIAARNAGTGGVTPTGVNRAYLFLSNGGGSHNVIGSNDGLAFSAQGHLSYDSINDQMRLKNGNLGIGTGYSASARLDIKAQGALSTDIALRVRNSANTGDLLSVQGDGKYSINDGGGVTSNAFSYISDGRMFMAKSGANFIELNPSGQNRMYMNSNGLEISVGASNIFNVQCSTTAFRVLQNCVQINTGAHSSSGTNYLMIQNGTAPSANPTDHYSLYSADITAGNAAPHFRTENGNIIKIYRETTAVAAAAFVANTSLIANDSATFGGYTMGQVVAALKAQGLLA